MNDLKEIIKDILNTGYLMSLGTQDDGGIWVADVMYVFDEDFNLYWLSREKTRHSKAVLSHPQVAVTITAVDATFEENKGLQISGQAVKIDGIMPDMSLKMWQKRGKTPPAGKEVTLSDGESWYKLTPELLEIIHEPLFGFEKKVYKP